MKSRHLIPAAVAFLVVLWLAWPDGEPEPATPSGDQTAQTSEKGKPVQAGEPADQAPDTKSPERKPGRSVDARIQRLLEDDGISTDEAARELRRMADDSRLSLPDRVEALGHGLNLDPDWQYFRDFGGEQTPLELAEPFLNDLRNHNELRSWQLRGVLRYLFHPDPEIAEEALGLLRFYMEDDAAEKTRSELLKGVEEKIHALEQEEAQQKEHEAAPQKAESAVE